MIMCEFGLEIKWIRGEREMTSGCLPRISDSSLYCSSAQRISGHLEAELVFEMNYKVVGDIRI